MKPIVILGPTAVGKSDIAVQLAEKINAEIISADAYQIYRYMDIGTAKPTPQQLKRIRHHNISILNPGEEYSSGRFVEDVERLINEIKGRGKSVIIVGGTGFYVDSLLVRLDDIPPVSGQLKGFLDDVVHRYGCDTLYRWLELLDEKWAGRISESDAQRIKRGLSVFVETGKPISAYFGSKKRSEEFLVFVLYASKDYINKRIEKRVDAMVASGLLEEVKKLIDMGYGSTSAMKAIGYREMSRYLAGEITFEDAVHLIKKNTKAYAKRQMTLLKNRFSSAVWINVEQTDALREIMRHLPLP